MKFWRSRPSGVDLGPVQQMWSILRSWEKTSVPPRWTFSAADVPAVGERILLARPAASINRKLAPGIVPRLPSALFPVVSNKLQLLPGLHGEPCYRRTAQPHRPERSSMRSFKLNCDVPQNIPVKSFLDLKPKATALSCFSTSEENARQLLWIFLPSSALRILLRSRTFTLSSL